MNQGDCDFDHQCQFGLKCFSNNCPTNSSYETTDDCCTDEDGFTTFLIESCVFNYCQDGIEAYYGTETQQYTYTSIYGHYDLQLGNVNGRPYFKKGNYGLWWNGVEDWWIGYDSKKGQSIGFAYYTKDVFCPHQLTDRNWRLYDGSDWKAAGKDLGISCK